MVKARHISFDVKTGKETVTETEFTPKPPIEQSGFVVNLEELKSLLEYAKNKGWI
jgi:hypothetical protein